MYRLQSLIAATLILASCGNAGEGAPAAAGNGDSAAATADTTSMTSGRTPESAVQDTGARRPTDRVPPTTAAEIGPDSQASSGTAAGDAVEPAETAPDTQDPVRLLRRTAGIYAAMSGLQAEFTMFTRNPLLGTQVTSHGLLYQRRPDRIRLDFSDPEGDEIVGDGEYFWVYYPSVDPVQVTKTPVAGRTGVVDLQAQFVGDPLTRFEHTVEGTEQVNGHEAVAISLVPREDLGYRKLKVWIDTADNLVRRFEITDPNGVTRLLELRELRINPSLADSLFRFTPPPGTHVVERG